MKHSLFILFLFVSSLGAKAQKLDSLFFNLYTDSLKKGTYNYINVDGKYSNGTWLPLTAKELIFSASSGEFDGNSLFIDSNTRDEKVKVKIVLRSNPGVYREMEIYIKKLPETERLKTVDEILNSPRKPAKTKKGRNSSFVR